MKKKELKGFTLVELLVVIAILAVLATVSVVGYTSFITKANNSNALTELKQAQEVILSQLIDATGAADGQIVAGGVTFEYDSAAGKIVFWGNADGGLDEAFKSNGEGGTNIPKDLAGLKGEFVLSNPGTKENNAAIITYTTQNGKGTATWQSNDVVKAGDGSAASEEVETPGEDVE